MSKYEELPERMKEIEQGTGVSLQNAIDWLNAKFQRHDEEDDLAAAQYLLVLRDALKLATASRPTKGDPMLDAVLKTEDPKFRAWVETLPATYWARYDLSACRIGWHFGRDALAKEIER